MTAPPIPVTPLDIERAAHRIGRYVRRTPVIEVDETFGIPGSVVAKLELLQHAGSFKTRGAFNRVLAAQEQSLLGPAGVIAASGGNHGAALAFVARTLGLRAEIFVPASSPRIKVERIASYGAEVIVGGAYYDEALEACRARQRETGAFEVHAYDHVDTVAGQGTMAREVEQQVGPIDTMLVACGGGGFVAGQGAWFVRRVKVVSVEPELIPAMARSLAADERIEVSVSGVAADSLGAKRIGEVPFAVARRTLAAAVLVTDDAIRAAQRTMWDRWRLMVEPGGAAAMAALLSGSYVPASDERVCVAVCGSNLDVSTVLDPEV